MTPLHEDLQRKLNRFHHYVPNIFIFQLLKESNADQLVLFDHLIANSKTHDLK